MAYGLQELVEARPQAGVEAQSAVRPGAGAVAPSCPPSVSQKSPVPGPRPAPRAHSGQGQGRPAQLGASAQRLQDWLPAVSTPCRRRPHVPPWALAACCFGVGAAVCHRSIRQTRGPCSTSATSPASRFWAGGVLLSSRRKPGADSDFQVTGNNPAIVQCTHGHWQYLKRKITWLPSPKSAFEWRYTSPCPQGCSQHSGRAG